MLIETSEFSNESMRWSVPTLNKFSFSSDIKISPTPHEHNQRELNAFGNFLNGFQQPKTETGALLTISFTLYHL